MNKLKKVHQTDLTKTEPPGSEETFQVVFGKKVACLHEKTSLFYLLCISFRTYLGFDKSYDSSYFQLSFIYHNHHGQKAIKYYIPNFYQIQDMFME